MPRKKIIKMIEAREQLSYKERLKMLRLFSLKEKRLKGDMIEVCII